MLTRAPLELATAPDRACVRRPSRKAKRGVRRAPLVQVLVVPFVCSGKLRCRITCFAVAAHRGQANSPPFPSGAQAPKKLPGEEQHVDHFALSSLLRSTAAPEQ
jgi:hypothetical protein